MVLVDLTQQHKESLDPLKHGSVIKINVKKKINFHFRM